MSDKIVPTIVANCRRLLSDAQVMLDHGSAGAAVALAILAFEEVGKGHYVELEASKPKMTPSWHQARQVLASFVLMASVLQKYGIERPEFPPELQAMLDESRAGAKLLSEFVARPIPELARDKVIELNKGALDQLDNDAVTIFRIELRWAKKDIAAASGEAERQRQRGIYVDFNGDTVSSDPSDVSKRDAVYWINVAQRALNLLDAGEYKAPYGELAALLEAMPRPLPNDEALMELFAQIEVRARGENEKVAEGGTP